MKIFFAPNTSDQDLVNRSIEKLSQIGFDRQSIQINYNTYELESGDIFVSYDPPDLVIRRVYEKKSNGMVKMKSARVIKL